MLVEKHCKAREAKELEELLARKEHRMRKTRDMRLGMGICMA